MSEMQLDLKGMEELQEAMKKAIEKYPGTAEEHLENAGKSFKKRVLKITDSAVDRHTGNLKKGYKLGPVKAFGTRMYIEFSGTAKHFHLIENGHNQMLPKRRKGKETKNGGAVVGFVPGRLIVKQARAEYQEKMPQLMEEMVDDIRKGSGL